MKELTLISILFFLCSGAKAWEPVTLSGHGTPLVGRNYTYTFDIGVNILGGTWEITGGTITS